MSLNVVFSLLFSYLFRRIGWLPLGGLALANSLATALETLGLLYLMRRRLNGIQGRQILLGLGQASLAGLLMAGGIWFWLAQTAQRSVWLVAVGGVVIGVACYGFLVVLMKVPEIHETHSGGPAAHCSLSGLPAGHPQQLADRQTHQHACQGFERSVAKDLAQFFFLKGVTAGQIENDRIDSFGMFTRLAPYASGIIDNDHRQHKAQSIQR